MNLLKYWNWLVDPPALSTIETSPDSLPPGSSENFEDPWLKLYSELKEANALDFLNELGDSVHKAFYKMGKKSKNDFTGWLLLVSVEKMMNERKELCDKIERLQNALLQDELGRNFRQITAYVENGIANQADLDAVKVEQLNTRQKRVELTFSRMAYLKMLSLLMGEVLSPETVLEKPVLQNELSAVSEIHRPELSWFDAQGAGLQVQEKALNVRHLPHIGLFVQGAYGNPGLNMLKNEFSPYYIAGVRLSWNFGSLYTLKNDRRVIENKRKQLDSNRDVFLFNTRLEMTQQDQSVRSLEKQMQDDDEIIRLRTNIRRAAEAKVANGTLTVTEMLRELTNESLARQAKAMHEIQRLMGIYQLKYTTNH